MTLPARFEPTRESLRAVACYAISPARKARTGRIGLRATGDGFGTPPFEDGSRIAVRGDRLLRDPGPGVVLTTVRDAAAFLDVELSADPGVGHDLPPFEPDAPLAIDAESSLTLGRWYGLGQSVLDALRDQLPDGAAITEAQLWPEHFDLAVTVELAGGAGVNVGFSPGDTGIAEPYAYVGPHDLDGLEGDYWNVPFGAVMRHGELDGSDERALAFVLRGLGLV